MKRGSAALMCQPATHGRWSSVNGTMGRWSDATHMYARHVQADQRFSGRLGSLQLKPELVRGSSATAYKSPLFEPCSLNEHQPDAGGLEWEKHCVTALNGTKIGARRQIKRAAPQRLPSSSGSKSFESINGEASGRIRWCRVGRSRRISDDLGSIFNPDLSFHSYHRHSHSVRETSHT